jgi:hypothetical protein
LRLHKLSEDPSYLIKPPSFERRNLKKAVQRLDDESARWNIKKRSRLCNEVINCHAISTTNLRNPGQFQIHADYSGLKRFQIQTLAHIVSPLYVPDKIADRSTSATASFIKAPLRFGSPNTQRLIRNDCGETVCDRSHGLIMGFRYQFVRQSETRERMRESAVAQVKSGGHITFDSERKQELAYCIATWIH